MRDRSRDHSGGGGEVCAGEVSMRLRQALVEIQRGAASDPHGWLHHARVSFER